MTNDFGTPGVKEHALALETADDAARFHRRLVNACIRANTQTEPLRPEQLHVAIIGAGATGTELAAELHKTTRQLIAFGLDRIDPDKDIRIDLIEAAPRILPALPERLSEAAVKLLEGLGVRLHVGARVAEVLPNGVRLATGLVIPAELVVWSAGIKAPEFLKGHRRAGDQQHQPAGRAPDAADDARRQCLRTRRLRRLSLAGPHWSCAAARPGRAPAGLASGRATAASSEGRAAQGLALSRLRLAGVARNLFHRRQPDGQADRRQPVRRGRCSPG